MRTRINSRYCCFLGLALLALVFSAVRPAQAADDKPDHPARIDMPTDPKALKTFNEAKDYERQRLKGSAFDSFRKANKQSGGNCYQCLKNALRVAMDIGDYKSATECERELIALAQSDAERASFHLTLGRSLQQWGTSEKKRPLLEESVNEFKASLSAAPGAYLNYYYLGISQAFLQKADESKQSFQTFLDHDHNSPDLHIRAQRFITRPELASAKMAPAFSATTIDGDKISLDGFEGKVVLIDFWATWCGPCREALPRIQQIAKKFAGQPLVVISISLDSNQESWKSFVGKNQMTWLQVRDGGFEGPIAKRFNVKAIPSTFTIDGDGVLEDQHVGDADLEGKLKKYIKIAAQAQTRAQSQSQAQ